MAGGPSDPAAGRTCLLETFGRTARTALESAAGRYKRAAVIRRAYIPTGAAASHQPRPGGPEPQQRHGGRRQLRSKR